MSAGVENRTLLQTTSQLSSGAEMNLSGLVMGTPWDCDSVGAVINAICQKGSWRGFDPGEISAS